MKQKKSLIWLAIAFLLSFAVTQLQDGEPRFQSEPSVSEGILTAIFLDTGNSDSALIHFPDGKTMLIDAGKPDDFKTIRNAMKRLREDTIDYAVITHQHDDHIGSFPEVLKNYPVKAVYMPVSDISNPQTKESMQLIEELEIPFITAKAGVTVCDGEVKASFLSPLYEHYGDKNDYSAVLHLTYGDHSFLLMGDATVEVENDLRTKGLLPKADVLKVGHHGSKTSTGKPFLNIVKPTYAIIPTGENDYGHPHKAVMDRLHAMGITTYRNDEAGDITVTSDKTTLTISTELEKAS